ncbi:MAG: hypothetical protein ACK4IX_13325 [Candidatus Sericytochromatia bacterium]
MRKVKEIKNEKGIIISFNKFSDEYLNYHKSNWKNYFISAKDELFILLEKYNGFEHILLNDLIDNFERIIKATPSEIPSIIDHFTTGNFAHLLISLTGDKTDLCKDIEKAFDYINFRSSAKASWFCEKIEIKSCLYCNAQFTLAVGKNGSSKKMLFQLDHFYNKRSYPFLSLTLGNLIPCCSSCNIAKSKKEFNIDDNFHPYHEDLSSNFTFKVDEENILKYLIEKRDMDFLKPTIVTTNAKVLEHVKNFRIEHIYNKHTDVIEELILKSLYYNSTKREELLNTFEELNLDQSTIDRFILGNYTLNSEINKRPLSKLSSDIAKQLKIIK